jgi:hypothetical protein
MKHTRKILGLLLLSLLIASMVYSYKNYEQNDPYLQKLNQIFTHPEHYNNTEISFIAEILSIDATNHTLRAFIQEKPYTYPQIQINTQNLDIQNLQKGDLIDVITMYTGNSTFTATTFWRNEPWKDTLIYLRSLPAIPFVLYLFFRTWRFNKTTWRFERRNNRA